MAIASCAYRALADHQVVIFRQQTDRQLSVYCSGWSILFYGY